MSNSLPFIRATGINAAGFIEWETEGPGEPTTDFLKAKPTDSFYTGYTSFASTYIRGLVRLISGPEGQVHIKSLLQLPEALVKESAGAEHTLEQVLKDLPPGKYGLGSIVYSAGFPAEVIGLNTSVRYDANGKKDEQVLYDLSLNDGTSRYLNGRDESQLSILPLNQQRALLSANYVVRDIPIHAATLVPGEPMIDIDGDE